MQKLILYHSYYDNCDNWNTYIPFEATSKDDAEFALLEAQDNSSEFCGITVTNNSNESSCIYTLDEWFDSNKRKM